MWTNCKLSRTTQSLYGMVPVQECCRYEYVANGTTRSTIELEGRIVMLAMDFITVRRQFTVGCT